MNVDPNSHNDSTQPRSGRKKREPSHLRWVFIGGVVAFASLLAAAIWWPNLSERTKFFTGNLLNLVIALAVIAQVLIYRKQRDVMEEQWQAMIDGLERTDQIIERMKEQRTEMGLQNETMRGQLAQIQRQADLAEKQIRIIAEGQRAHIGIQNVIQTIVVEGKRPELTILFHNGGQTVQGSLPRTALSSSEKYRALTAFVGIAHRPKQAAGALW